MRVRAAFFDPPGLTFLIQQKRRAGFFTLYAQPIVREYRPSFVTLRLGKKKGKLRSSALDSERVECDVAVICSECYVEVSLQQRRAHRRFKTGAPITFSWKADGQIETSRGTVENISVQGMYVVASMCPPEKSTVRCIVLFPALAQNAAPAEVTVASTIGTVLRTDDEQSGFAVKNRALRLEPRMNTAESMGSAQ